jgi:hypothetical protein
MKGCYHYGGGPGARHGRVTLIVSADSQEGSSAYVRNRGLASRRQLFVQPLDTSDSLEIHATIAQIVAEDERPAIEGAPSIDALICNMI